jgi:hypothetical protein
MIGEGKAHRRAERLHSLERFWSAGTRHGFFSPLKAPLTHAFGLRLPPHSKACSMGIYYVCSNETHGINDAVQQIVGRERRGRVSTRIIGRKCLDPRRRGNSTVGLLVLSRLLSFAKLKRRLDGGFLTMSNEEVDRRMAFVIEQQVQFASDIQQLREAQLELHATQAQTG